MPLRALIVGCGYVGLPLALRLRNEGHEVSVWVHSQATATDLARYDFRHIFIGSVADETLWADVPADFDLAIHCASSGRGGVEAYEDVFLRGVPAMNRHLPLARRLFVSSTSVYGQNDGEIVTEEIPCYPGSATAKILAETETAALAQGTIIVRSSGIYGPGRGVLFEKFRRGEAVIEGDGTRWINMIHQRDLVAAITHLAQVGEPGQVYNATDDTPVTYNDFYTWSSSFLDKPMPPHGPVNPNRKRGVTNKRVSNAKLRATGWRPVYPSFREGLGIDHGILLANSPATA